MSDAKEGEGTRRDFLYLATGAAGVVAVGGIAWPLLEQLAPNAREVAAGAPVEVDVSAVEPGMQITVLWRSKPYFVRRLTSEELEAIEGAEQGAFRDYVSAETRLAVPGSEGDDSAEAAPAEWTIVAANCTHLGCVPTKVETGLEGWVCPCHGSIFDAVGRVMKGPAPTNLPLPPYNFASVNRLVIGEEGSRA
ncbi:MAG: ubiquinol-cytochrome c reductase iron-sulfur subunit [Ahrensia sp.]|nr:ubiquinol-cytochrome c reductase iron-sulfur subunit [Ahrensia sp.]